MNKIKMMIGVLILLLAVGCQVEKEMVNEEVVVPQITIVSNDEEKADSSDAYEAIYLTPEEGAVVLATEDDYIKYLTAFDYQAKFQSDVPLTEDERKAFYDKVTMPFTEADKKKIDKAVAYLNNRIKPLNLNAPTTVEFIKTNGEEESGAAYTRGTAIILPDNMLSNSDDITGLVAHEFFHVFSRYNKDKRAEMYEIIGFKEAESIEYPDEIRDLRISNPDAPDIRYYFEDEYEGVVYQLVPMIYADRAYDPNYATGFFSYLEVAALGVTVEENVLKPVYVDDGPLLVNMYHLPNFMEQTGGNTGYIIHPEEILADNFQKYVTKDSVESQWVIDDLVEFIRN